MTPPTPRTSGAASAATSSPETRRPNRLEGGPSFDIVTSIDGIGGNDVIVGHSAAGTDVCQGDAGPPPDSVHCP